MIVNLEPQTLIAVNLNTSNHNFVFNKEKMVIPKSVQDISLDDIKDILLNNQIKYPDYVYTEARGVYQKIHEKLFIDSGVKHSLIYLPNSMLGVEFVKSHIYTSPFIEKINSTSVKKILNAIKGKVEVDAKFAAILECIYGNCVVIMQRRITKSNPKDIYASSTHDVIESGIAKLKKGERTLIPPGYDYSIINIKSSPCIVSKFYKQTYQLNYKSIKDSKGLGYYVIRKNGRIEVTPNSKYKSAVKIRNIKIKEMMKAYKLDFRGSLYSNFVNMKQHEHISNSLLDFRKYIST
jgi:hypothetical protein